MASYSPVSSSVNIRSFPHPAARWLGALQPGQDVEVIEQRGNWGRIDYGSAHAGGWVDLEQMRQCPDEMTVSDAVEAVKRVAARLPR